MERRERTRAQDPLSVPRDLDEADLVVIDTTWGEIQPLEAAPGVRTVGERELLDLARSGAVLVDTRVPGSRGGLHDWVSLGYPTEAVPRPEEDGS